MRIARNGRLGAALLPLCALAMLAGCAGQEEPQPQAEQQMIIGVELRPVHRCSRISPEMTVAYAPSGTKFYRVRLMEYADGGERFIGGGDWNADGTGLIPEGALTTHYMGPCPPDGQTRDYAYVISAMSVEGEPPLAVSTYRFTQE